MESLTLNLHRLYSRNDDDPERLYNQKCSTNSMCEANLKCCMGNHQNVYDPATGKTFTGYYAACDLPDSPTCESYKGKWVQPFLIALGGFFAFILFCCVMSGCCRVCREEREKDRREYRQPPPPLKIVCDKCEQKQLKRR